MDRISTKGQMVEQIDLRGVPHSGFDESNHNFQSCKLGKIVPARIDGLYPGDRIKGSPEISALFEPLAGPVSGSLVLKQESFYVPIYEVWRHAERFFTQKDETLTTPSCSPRSIYGAYASFKLLDINQPTALPGKTYISMISFMKALRYSYLHDDYLWINDTHTITFEETYSLLNQFALDRAGKLTAFGNQYEVLDLLQPQIDRILKTFVWKNNADGTENKSSMYYLLKQMFVQGTAFKQIALIIFNQIHRFLIDYYNYFFGASSLMDYIGYPCLGDFKDSDIMTRLVAWFNDENFTDYTWTELTDVSSSFSQIPLTFLPFRAYYLIWYWNYRDQLLEKVAYDCDSDTFTDDSIAEIQKVLFTLLRVRCWYKDSYTTALTNTGSGNMLVPTLGNLDGNLDFTYYDSAGQLINTKDAADAFKSGAMVCEMSLGTVTYRVPMNYLGASFSPLDSTSSESDFISLDLFDRIRRLQNFVKKRLTLGYEVDDVVYSSFLVKMSNVRLRIPELLGRGRDEIKITTIVNNTTTTEQVAGDKTAVASAYGKSSDINYFSEEWGFYMHLYTIMPIQSYTGGMSRMWLKKDIFDYMWPEFATMGMDAVYNCELAAPGARLSDDQALLVFGYQGRYYDLKSRQDEVHGRLRTDLHYLTFSRDWDSNNPPKLNYIFVHCWPSLEPFVTDSEDVDVVRQVDIYHGIAMERRLPVPSEFI